MVVVVGGDVLHQVKREGNCPGVGSVRGIYAQGRKCPLFTYCIGGKSILSSERLCVMRLYRRKISVRLE